MRKKIAIVLMTVFLSSSLNALPGSGEGYESYQENYAAMCEGGWVYYTVTHCRWAWFDYCYPTKLPKNLCQ